MQDMCRCRIVPASALPKVLICTLQTMRHWGRLQWGERRGGVVLFCYGDIYYEESRRQGAAWLTGQGGGWWQFLLLLLSTPCPCSPALHPLYSYCHLVTGHLEPHYLGYSYSRCKHFSVSQLPFPVWTRETMPMHRNVECECALESFDRKDGTSTFPIIWKLFRILNFDIIFNSSGIKQVGHIEIDKICKITFIPYIYPTPRAAVCTENFI